MIQSWSGDRSFYGFLVADVISGQGVVTEEIRLRRMHVSRTPRHAFSCLGPGAKSSIIYKSLKNSFSRSDGLIHPDGK